MTYVRSYFTVGIINITSFVSEMGAMCGGEVSNWSAIECYSSAFSCNCKAKSMDSQLL